MILDGLAQALPRPWRTAFDRPSAACCARRLGGPSHVGDAVIPVHGARRALGLHTWSFERMGLAWASWQWLRIGKRPRAEAVWAGGHMRGA